MYAIPLRTVAMSWRNWGGRSGCWGLVRLSLRVSLRAESLWVRRWESEEGEGSMRSRRWRGRSDLMAASLVMKRERRKSKGTRGKWA